MFVWERDKEKERIREKENLSLCAKYVPQFYGIFLLVAVSLIAD